jgi:uncharacterized protein HemX
MGISGALVAVAAIGAGYGIASGEEAKSDRKQAMRRQEQQQKQAEATALNQKLRSAQDVAKANQQEFDPLALAGFENSIAVPDLGAAVPRSALKTSGPTLLGDT